MKYAAKPASVVVTEEAEESSLIEDILAQTDKSRPKANLRKRKQSSCAISKFPPHELRFQVHVYTHAVRNNKIYGRENPTVIVRDKERPGQFLLCYEANIDGPSRLAQGPALKGGTTVYIETPGPIYVKLDRDSPPVLLDKQSWPENQTRSIKTYSGCGGYSEEDLT